MMSRYGVDQLRRIPVLGIASISPTSRSRRISRWTVE